MPTLPTRLTTAATLALALTTTLAACTDPATESGNAGKSPASATKAKSVPASTPAPQPFLRLSVPGGGRTVYRDDVVLRGRVYAPNGGNTKGVRVEVDGKVANVKDGQWSRRVKVQRGENEFEIVATKSGYDQDSEGASVTRRSSQAEIEARRVKREQERARRKASYMAGAKLLPYNQLEKNAERHAGERVKFTGQIFQIQEDFGSSVILLSVTDEGYGFWTDNIWVDYEGTINGAEDDVITVYGTIEGSKSYDTQIGGETYVPQMTAKYVVE